MPDYRFSLIRSVSQSVPSLFLVPVLALSCLSACVPAAIVGGGAYAVSTATSERGVGGAVSDTQIRIGINKKWWEGDADISKRLSLTVNEGRVLITGIARSAEQKMEASRLAWEVTGVREVINEASLEGEETLSSYAKDTWITTKLRSILVFDGEVASRNYTIETINGVVYLMGYARNQQELSRVTTHASNITGVNRVVSYARIGNEILQPANSTPTSSPNAVSPSPSGSTGNYNSSSTGVSGYHGY